MASRSAELDRRRALCALAAVAAGCAGSDGPACSGPPDGVAGWIELPLSRYPALAVPGGAAAVQVPEALLDAIVIHTPEGCLRALWAICPHGGCYLGYRAAERVLVCPCHGSRFDEEGRLLRGPADRDLRSFPAAHGGGSLWIRRG